MKKYIGLLKDTISHWSSSNPFRMSAALSYYAIFSIIPLFVLVIAIVGSIFGRSVVEGDAVRHINSIFGQTNGRYLQSVIQVAVRQHIGIVGTIIGILTIILGAIAIFTELDQDLDDIWRISTKQKDGAPEKTSIWETTKTLIRNRIIAFSLVPIISLLFLFSVAFTVFLSLYQDTFGALSHFSGLFQLAQAIFTFLLTIFFFTLVYRILPSIDLPWRELFLGAVVTAFLFLIGQLLISWYISSFASESAYGTAGSILAMLLWVYYSAQVFFLGASFIFVYSKQYGYLSNYHL